MKVQENIWNPNNETRNFFCFFVLNKIYNEFWYFHVSED